MIELILLRVSLSSMPRVLVFDETYLDLVGETLTLLLLLPLLNEAMLHNDSLAFFWAEAGGHGEPALLISLPLALVLYTQAVSKKKHLSRYVRLITTYVH